MVRLFLLIPHPTRFTTHPVPSTAFLQSNLRLFSFSNRLQYVLSGCRFQVHSCGSIKTISPKPILSNVTLNNVFFPEGNTFIASASSCVNFFIVCKFKNRALPRAMLPLIITYKTSALVSPSSKKFTAS